jgi:hypothetical protein
MSAGKWLKANPKLPEGDPKNIAIAFETFSTMLTQLFDDKITIEGIDQWELMYQKLLEAKDCAVRAVLFN